MSNTHKRKPDVSSALMWLMDAQVALLGAAIADQQLQDALLTRMRTLKAKDRDRIFSGYGPLSSFAAKIDLAFAFELIDAATRNRLTAVRQIRNKFAHSDWFLSFEHPEIVAILKKLPANTENIVDSQKIFLWQLTMVESHLVATAGAGILKPKQGPAAVLPSR